MIAAQFIMANHRFFRLNAMQSTHPIVNISAYKFVTLDDTAEMRPRFQNNARISG